MNFKFGNLNYLNDSDKMGDMSQLPLYTGKSNYLNKLKRNGSSRLMNGLTLSKPTIPKILESAGHRNAVVLQEDTGKQIGSSYKPTGLNNDIRY